MATRPLPPVDGPRIVTSLRAVDDILQAHRASLAADFDAYRNHVYRLLSYFGALAGCDEMPPAVCLAAAFHDLGIWTDDTFDYLPPSLRLARGHLDASGLTQLQPHVDALIEQHHKLLPCVGPFAATAEPFRRADLVDCSAGLWRFGLPGGFVRAVKSALPDAGFHARLVALAGRQLLRQPWRPFPMLRW
jgi:hypothetical protein